MIRLTYKENDMKVAIGKQIILFLFFLVIYKHLNAQKVPIKFGKIDIEDFETINYETDTSATALVLCDYGEFNSDEFEFTRHCRIKILKKDGAKYADNYVRTGSHLNLKARTYNLVNGEIEVSKMRGSSVFEDRIDNHRVGTRFTLPNVKVGSIIEFSYTFSGIPYAWRFQQEIPVIWSELRMRQSPYVTVQKNFIGFEPLDIVEDNRWVAKDMPAFRAEPYISSSLNYMTQFEFEISDIAIPGKLYKFFTTSWDQVSETLYYDDFFADKIKGNWFFNDIANEIKSLDLNELQKAKYVYDMIQERIVWNDIKNIFVYKELRFAYDKKVGSVAEINFILISLLNKVGIRAYPVVLSTRDNGIISPFFPSIRKLNYVIALAEIDEKEYLLDATDRLVPFGMLPKRCLNGEGRTIEKEDSKWVKLNTSFSSKEVICSDIILTNTGEIKGNVSYKLYDYAAYDLRKKVKEFATIDDYIKYREGKHAGMNIEEFKFENIDSIYSPVAANFKVNLRNDANIISDKIYLNPFLFERVDDNPFKSEKREYPVDFVHPIEKTYIFNMEIPEGYIVENLPESSSVALPNKKGNFICSVKNMENKLQYTYKFIINDPIILPTEYEYLKQFYELLVKKHSEMIVLKKNKI